MKRMLVVWVVLVLTGVVGLNLAAQQSGRSQSSLKGVWRASEIRYNGPNARTVTNPQPWLLFITDKHLASIGVSSGTARPRLPAPDQQTDKQLADAYRNFVAFAGTYQVNGSEFPHLRIVDLHPNRTEAGFSAFPSFRLEGNDAFWWIGGTRNSEGPVPNTTDYKFVRIE